jgi:hypothetical protein
MIEQSDFEEMFKARGGKPSAIADAWPAYENVGGSVAQFLDARENSRPHEFDTETTEGPPIECFSPDAQAAYARKYSHGELVALLAKFKLEPGQVLPGKPYAPNGSKLHHSKNPYHATFRGDRAAKIAELMRVMGHKAVAGMAAANNRRTLGVGARANMSEDEVRSEVAS